MPPRHIDGLRSGDRIVIIGAGPAGLTAAYLLAKAGHPVTVLEADRLGRRHLPHGRVQRLPLRHRRAPLLHQDRPSFRRSGRSCSATSSSTCRGSRASTTTGKLLRLSAARLVNALPGLGPGQRRPDRPELPRGRALSGTRSRRTSSSGSPTDSAGGSTRSSSRPTPRRCGASRAPRSAPSGRRSASRGCRWRGRSCPPRP